MDHIQAGSFGTDLPRLNGSRRQTMTMRPRTGDQDRYDERDPSARQGDPLAPDELVRNAVSQFSAMSGRQVEAVIGWDRNEQGVHIEVEVVEVRQMPQLADILATYEADVNDEGRLCSYRRRRRYARGQVGTC